MINNVLFFIILLFLCSCGNAVEQKESENSKMEVTLLNDSTIVLQGREVSIEDFAPRYKEEEANLLERIDPDHRYLVELRVAKDTRMKALTSVQEVLKASSAEKIVVSQL